MSQRQNNPASTSNSVTNDTGVGIPKRGETYRCSKCGMALQITEDCSCKEPNHVHFHCCGQEMQRG
jgi:hypothetical protein